MVAIIKPLLILSLLNFNKIKNKATFGNNAKDITGTYTLPLKNIPKNSFKGMPEGAIESEIISIKIAAISKPNPIPSIISFLGVKIYSNCFKC